MKAHRFARRCRLPPDLDLRDGRALEAFDEYEIGGAEALRKLLERWRGSAPHLARELPLGRGNHGGLDGARARMAFAVSGAVVRAQLVMRMLRRSDPEALAREGRNEAFDEGGLAGILPADDADQRRRASHAPSPQRRARREAPAPSPDPAAY